jgi:hypothetical protein
MSFFPCSDCGQRERGKLAGVYAYWYEPTGERSAWRKRCCVVCLTSLMGSLKGGQSADSSILTACPICGEDSSQTLSGVFLTIYPPRQPEREYALTTCGSCSQSLREHLSKNADPLTDRGSVGAAAPTQPRTDDWSSVPW